LHICYEKVVKSIPQVAHLMDTEMEWGFEPNARLKQNLGIMKRNQAGDMEETCWFGVS
jgi:hypothetical protein